MLTYGTESNQWVFPRVNGVVIRPVAPHVCSAVDQPGSIEHQSVSEESREEVSHMEGFTPEVPGDKHGHQEAKHHYGRLVVPEMEKKIYFHTRSPGMK